MLFSALNRNTEAGPLQGLVVPNLASQADREQEFEPGPDIDSAADVCCADVSMYLHVSNPVRAHHSQSDFAKKASQITLRGS